MFKRDELAEAKATVDAVREELLLLENEVKECSHQQLLVEASTHANSDTPFKAAWEELEESVYSYMGLMCLTIGVPTQVAYRYVGNINPASKHSIEATRELLQGVSAEVLRGCTTDTYAHSMISVSLSGGITVEAYRSGDYRFQWVIVPHENSTYKVYVVSRGARYMIAGSHLGNLEFIANEYILCPNGKVDLDCYKSDDVAATFDNLYRRWKWYHD